MKVGDLVYLRWEDSQGCPRGWDAISDARDEACALIESVGWVMCTGKRTVQIAPHVSSFKGQPGCVQGYMTIPKSCILQTQIIEGASSSSARGRTLRPSSRLARK